jgi:hypothetical protein
MTEKDRTGTISDRAEIGQLRSFAPDAQFNANRTFDEPPASVIASPLCLELFIGYHGGDSRRFFSPRATKSRLVALGRLNIPAEDSPC